VALQKSVDVFPLCLKVAPNFLNIEAFGKGLVQRSLELGFFGKVDLNEDAMLAGVKGIADGVHRLAYAPSRAAHPSLAAISDKLRGQ
jgi:hypothetical protein